MSILRGLVKLLAMSQQDKNTEKEPFQKTNARKTKAQVSASVSKRSVMAKLSSEMRPYVDNVWASKLPSLKISLAKQTQIEFTQSKVGGYPYFPESMALPLDASGNCLDFLAQINFEELPEIDGYPSAGIVQFFIARTDTYGLDFSDRKSQKNYRVIYHEHVESTNRTEFKELDELRKKSEYMSPLQSSIQYRMQFEKRTDFIPADSVYFNQFFDNKTFNFFERFGDKEREVAQAYRKLAISTGHKIGGYPYFTQDDPRMYDESIKNWVLLFQLDSEGDIMWGDVGVGNFFISPDALNRGDFSNVFYNWDCS